MIKQQLLTKLRQICIDPNVIYENYNGESIKLDSLINIVNENVQNGHKILIFSSFKRVLNNVRRILNENSITNYMIDGECRNKYLRTFDALQVELFSVDSIPFDVKCRIDLTK